LHCYCWRFDIDKLAKLVVAIKAKLTEYDDKIKDQRKGHSCGPPAHWAFEALLTATLEYGADKIGVTEHVKVKAFLEYYLKLNHNDRSQLILKCGVQKLGRTPNMVRLHVWVGSDMELDMRRTLRRAIDNTECAMLIGRPAPSALEYTIQDALTTLTKKKPKDVKG